MRIYSAPTLPLDFEPSSCHIIIGRGRAVKNHSANKKFDKLISIVAPEYQAANCKAEKGAILTRLMDKIHSEGPNAGFVKKDPATGLWQPVDESLARTTAAQAIRNFLHSSYRSSKQFKQQRRLQQIRDGLIPTSGTTRSYKSNCVSPDSSDDESSVTSTDQNDSSTFGILFNAFGSQTISRSDDPFAPTPILIKSNSQEQLTGSLMGLQPNPIVSPQLSKPLVAAPSSSVLEAFDAHLMSHVFQV